MGFSIIMAPIADFLKATTFKWGEEQQRSFETIKTAITTTPYLAIPDFVKSFQVETDAFSYDIDVVLSQEGQPIEFFSERLA